MTFETDIFSIISPFIALQSIENNLTVVEQIKVCHLHWLSWIIQNIKYPEHGPFIANMLHFPKKLINRMVRRNLHAIIKTKTIFVSKIADT